MDDSPTAIAEPPVEVPPSAPPDPEPDSAPAPEVPVEEPVAAPTEVRQEEQAPLPKLVLAAHGDRIICLRDAPRSEVGGMALPETAREQALSGLVLSVGDLVRPVWRPWWKWLYHFLFGIRPPTVIRAGTRIRLGTHAGYPVPEEGNPYLLILREDEIMAQERVFISPR